MKKWREDDCGEMAGRHKGSRYVPMCLHNMLSMIAGRYREVNVVLRHNIIIIYNTTSLLVSD